MQAVKLTTMSATYASICAGPEGVEIKCAEGHHFFKRVPARTLRFEWKEVTKVFVFKRDCFTVDSIRMLFELNGTHILEVSEEMPGWAELVGVVPVYLPGALNQAEWWGAVVDPTFELCWTQLYPRSADRLTPRCPDPILRKVDIECLANRNQLSTP